MPRAGMGGHGGGGFRGPGPGGFGGPHRGGRRGFGPGPGMPPPPPGGGCCCGPFMLMCLGIIGAILAFLL